MSTTPATGTCSMTARGRWPQVCESATMLGALAPSLASASVTITVGPILM